MAKKPRTGRMSGARNSAAVPGRVVGSSLAAPATEPTIGRDVGIAARTVPGKNGGTLLPRAPGSNGGVHRGPDKFPRKQVMQAIVMMSLAAEGFDVKHLPATFRALQAARRKSHRKLIPAAMAHQMVRANQNIVEEAAIGDREAYGRFLQLQRDFHQIMAGGSNGKNGHGTGHGAPFPSRFVPEEPGLAAPAKEPDPHDGGPLVIDGKEYVAGGA